MPFRSLHDELLDYEDRATFKDILSPWLEKHLPEVEWLRGFGKPTDLPIPTVSSEDLWELYALSRVFELLALRFQTGQADGSDWPGPVMSEIEFTSFAKRLGMTVVRPNRYAPFHHEIVELQPSARANQPAQLLRYHWPCLMLGNLLIMRAGVTVCAGSNILKPGIAEKSTLFWAYRRKNRPRQDLSDGWGHNSSWRTSFRRDYLIDHTFHFNVDGCNDLSEPLAEAVNEEGLTLEERRELVVNRCFVVTSKDDANLFPYDDRISIRAES